MMGLRVFLSRKGAPWLHGKKFVEEESRESESLSLQSASCCNDELTPKKSRNRRRSTKEQLPSPLSTWLSKKEQHLPVLTCQPDEPRESSSYRVVNREGYFVAFEQSFEWSIVAELREKCVEYLPRSRT